MKQNPTYNEFIIEQMIPLRCACIKGTAEQTVLCPIALALRGQLCKVVQTKSVSYANKFDLYQQAFRVSMTDTKDLARVHAANYCFGAINRAMRMCKYNSKPKGR